MPNQEYLRKNIEKLCKVLNENNFVNEYGNQWQYNEFIFGGAIVNDRNAFIFLKENGYIDINLCWRCGEHPIENNNVFTSHRYQDVKYSLCKNCYNVGVSMQKSAGLSHKSTGSNQNCYIATLCYGDVNSPQVEVFRQYRDNTLSKKFSGRLFITLYYLISPKIVRLLKDKKHINKLIKNVLDKLVIYIEDNS